MNIMIPQNCKSLDHVTNCQLFKAGSVA